MLQLTYKRQVVECGADVSVLSFGVVLLMVPLAVRCATSTSSSAPEPYALVTAAVQTACLKLSGLGWAIGESSTLTTLWAGTHRSRGRGVQRRPGLLPPPLLETAKRRRVVAQRRKYADCRGMGDRNRPHARISHPTLLCDAQCHMSRHVGGPLLSMDCVQTVWRVRARAQ